MVKQLEMKVLGKWSPLMNDLRNVVIYNIFVNLTRETITVLFDMSMENTIIKENVCMYSVCLLTVLLTVQNQYVCMYV